ncbi:MAG: ribosome silencing factor [Ignavibacteriales bacterium]|nr:ribosome silencing factor [Ignavibacteriales bacterium]
MTSIKFAKLIAELVQNKKGYNIKILDLRKLSAIADFFVVCSADSDRQVKAIADEVDEKLIEQGIKCLHREGYETLNWILLDYFDVVVHVFKVDARNYYNLEKFWGDAPVIEVADETEIAAEPKPKTRTRKSKKEN